MTSHASSKDEWTAAAQDSGFSVAIDFTNELTAMIGIYIYIQFFFGRLQLRHEKNPYYFPLYWLVNRDPYNGLL